MPTAAALSLVDNSAVTHTFAPVKGNPEMSVYVDRVGTNSAGDGVATCGLSFATASRKTHKVKQTYVMPIEATVDGVVVVRSKPRLGVEWILPDDMTVAERLKFDTLCEAFIQNATMRGLRRSLDPVY